MTDDDLKPSPTGGLTGYLYPTPAPRRVGAILKWWEKRRLPYNLAVGAAGLFTLGYGSLVALLPPNGGLDYPPPGGFLAYAVVLNLAYLLGPTVEIAVHKLFRGDVLPTGPALYRVGLTLGVGFTLLPSLVITIAWIARIFEFVF